MNQLKVISHNGQLVTESREVAKMIDRKHAHLLRDIQGYKEVLDHNPKLDSADFFIKDTYTNANNQSYLCFLLTRKGCDMVANKMTGEKGILFTAEYVTRFEEMENKLNKPKQPTTHLEVLQGAIGQLVEQDKRVTQLESDVNNISNIVSMNNVEWREKATVIIRKIAQKWSGVEPYRSVINLSYERLEKRAGCKLDIRLNNRKERALAKGMSKTQIKRLNKLDCIAEEKRLVEIYIQVVKELAIQFKVNINNFEEVI